MSDDETVEYLAIADDGAITLCAERRSAVWRIPVSLERVKADFPEVLEDVRAIDMLEEAIKK